ncbi:MAG: hypothetical protein JO266_05005 [Acidobacteria bacterium]|nr:hypothetical protein [Acidobacteriota bacterium]
MKPASSCTSYVGTQSLGLSVVDRIVKIYSLPARWALVPLLAIVPSAFAGTVTITSPANGSMDNSAVHVHATYTGGTGTATYMKMWIDHNPSTVEHSTNAFDTTTALSDGPHLIEVQALDPSGAFYVSAANITVVTLAVNPAATSLPPGGTQQFTYSDNSSSSITWSATGGSITSGGLYTASSTTGTFSVTANDSSANQTTAKMIVAPLHTVTFESPANNSTVSSPLLVQATYNGTVVATYMKLWIDHVAGLVQQNTNSFVTSVYLAGGAHLIEVQALDPATGLVYTSGVNITVPGGTGGGSLNYTTWKNDNMRSGQQLNETILTPSNVNSTHFGVLYTNPLDGAVFAQPLYVSNLSIGGGTHNVVFVATESNSVYAIDADHFDTSRHGNVYWHKVLMPPGATAVPQSKVRSTIFPHIGITGTPVIDPVAGTLYVVTETLESGTVVFRLHALSLTTGGEQHGGPVGISTSGFQPLEQLQRPGLLLAYGNLYIAFGSQGDNMPYHGWVFSHSPTTLAKINVWNATPTGKESAIWMGGSGIASDGNGYIYVMTSNGDWDGVSNFGESFVKLHSDLSSVYDYFTPYQQATFSADDQDVGSGGMLLLPPQPGAIPNEAVGCGKPRAIYLVDRDNMGKSQTNTNDQIVQEVDNAVGGLSGHQAPDACFMTPAYWQGNLYFGANNDNLRAFNMYLDSTDNKTKICAVSTSTVTCKTSKSPNLFGFPGAQPVVSSNKSSNGIVWAIQYSPFSSSGGVTPTAVLYAYSATNLANQLYQSSNLGSAAKFAVPTVINGKVYVGTASSLYAFASH